VARRAPYRLEQSAVPVGRTLDVGQPAVGLARERGTFSRIASLLGSALGRRTSGGRFVPEVDGMRFLAIAAVLLFHVGGFARHRATDGAAPAADWLSALIGPGYVGVQIFFAISGLILGLPFARARLGGAKPVSLRAYFLRRVTRLEPPYLVSLLLWTSMLILVKGVSVADALPHLGASAVYLHGALYGEPSFINGVAWSLEVEVQFYLCAPMLATLFAIRAPSVRRLAIVLGILSCALAQQWLHHPSAHNPLMGLSLAHQLHWFLVGFLVADLIVTRWKEAPPAADRGVRLAIDVVGATSLAGLWWLLQPLERSTPGAPEETGWFVHLIGSLFIFLILVAAFRGVVWRWIMSRPPIYLIGGMCYTIYLYHSLFKSAVGNITTQWQLGWSIESQVLLQTLLISGVIVAMSAVLFVLFERPFMRPFFQTPTARR
jgi:peptidoglycan/LPS O-acetylase OafA/YrhL